MDRFALVLAGGGIGALVRYIAATAIAQRFGARFPWGTFAINVTGSFAIGWLMTLFTEQWRPHTNLRLLLVVGFLGGYTTFSSFEYEALRTIQDGQLGLGLLYVALSVCFGFIAVWGGVMTGRAIP